MSSTIRLRFLGSISRRCATSILLSSASANFSSASRGRITQNDGLARWLRNDAYGSLLERVLHVLGIDLAADHRGLVVELDALAQREGVDLAVLGHPLLGQVGEDREIRRALLLRPVGEPHQPAVGEAD